MSFIFEWIYNGFSSVLQFLGNTALPSLQTGSPRAVASALWVSLARASCQNRLKAGS